MIVNYAIGDVHGRIDLLDRLLDQIETDVSSRYGLEDDISVVFLGDYVDRGPQSRAVIERVKNYDTYPSVALYGNHEDMMVASYRERSSSTSLMWCSNGGFTTMQSYGWSLDDVERFAHNDPVKLMSVVPEEHITWLESLPFIHETPLAVYVHAGINVYKPVSAQEQMFCIWSRTKDFLSGNFKSDKPVVHGHTIQHRAARSGNRIGMDTGAYKSNRLSAVVLDESGREDFIHT